MRLRRGRCPFDSQEWIFELKHDGFRPLAYLENDPCRLLSCNGHEFSGFKQLCDRIARHLKVQNATIEDEIVCCLGAEGRSIFNLLLFRIGLPYFLRFRSARRGAGL
jgi:bifunctional non-homologous end joining protein LigD